MTALGKFLALLNGAAALAFLGLALGMATNHVYYNSYQPDGGDKIVGLVELLQNRIKELADARDRAEARWAYESSVLAYHEAQRPGRLAFYDERLKVLRTGRDAAGAVVEAPVAELSFADGKLNLKEESRDGKLVYTMPNMQPFKSRDENIRSIEELDGKYEYKNDQWVMADPGRYQTLQKETSELANKVKELVAEQEKLTKAINGTPDTKGVRTRINEQTAVRRAAEQEFEFLRPILTNRVVEAQLLLQRQQALEARLRELGKKQVTFGGN